jgi:mycothiol synthase
MTQIDSVPIDVVIPGMPSIPGLRFRRPLGPADYRPLLDVYSAAAAADSLDEVMTEADMANFIENPIDSDPALDVLIAEVEGRVVAYAWISHRLETSGDRAERPAGDSAERPVGDEVHSHRGYVHPAWRRRGLGSAMLRQAWHRTAERALTDNPAAARLLQTFALETEAGADALARRFGYAPVRYAFKMHRDLSLPIPDLPLPAGIELRPAQPEHRRPIWEAQREAFQDHWGYAPWPEENYQRFLGFPHFDLSLWRIAWDGDQVVGTVLNYINDEENKLFSRRRGYTEDIAVRRPWRRRGLASALIARSLEALKERGMSEAALGVDAENRTGALRVYERLGYTPAQQWTIFRRPLPDQADTSRPGRTSID